MFKKEDTDETFFALRYPDYKSWRNLEDATKNGGRWPNGEPVRLSDPEMKPFMDEMKEKIRWDPVYARELLQKIGLIPKDKA